MTSQSVIEVPAWQNILQYTADYILENFSDREGDFSDIHVFLPNTQAIQQFNTILCHSSGKNLAAIIPPWAGTLAAWAGKFSRNEHNGYTVIGEYARQLLFIEALQEHPSLFKQENQWQVTQALLDMFDELSLNQLDLFSAPQAWQQRLQHAYGLEKQHQHLLYESDLVYTLWHAWQQQLDENQYYDETSDLISRLQAAANSVDKQQYFICPGFSHYSLTEQDFIQTLVNNNQCQLIEYASTLTPALPGIEPKEYSRRICVNFICETFKQAVPSDDTPAIKQRAEQFAKEHPDFCANDLPFSVYLATGEEAQIRAIDYYVRSNILNGKNNIAVISEDRKLSRRLRAMLERANIEIQDNAGWSLATTQAASIIERWLECIEEDFSAYPLLDCLKSPFISIARSVTGDAVTEEDFRKNVYRFEHDLVFHENISSNIKQYKSALRARLQRLSRWPANSSDTLTGTLDFIEKTAKPLSGLYAATNPRIILSDFLDALLNSLEQLGVLQQYQHDEAGHLLLQTFEELKHAVQFSNPALSWSDCRSWLGMALESRHFTPSTTHAVVQLMTLEQASHMSFDCIVIAGCEAQHFPGTAASSPFFNQAVRASLGLKTWQEQRRQRHELFNRALLSAPDILITACDEEQGEKKPVSPWLELIISFSELALGNTGTNIHIYNNALKNIINLDYNVFNCDDATLPEPAVQPSPSIPQDLVPQKVTASSYQRLINCPYQFFSTDGLALKPREELSDELKKSDYGERIHLILQCFHSGHKKFGKAFEQSISEINRQQAEAYLEQLSEKVFLADMENNVLHRSWLYRWKKHIPSYISWQINQQNDWKIYLSEKIIDTSLDDTKVQDAIRLHGRLDRIDLNKENGTHAIIDYKTGRTASQQDIDSGENVQLSSYALLDTEASEVSYLSLDSSDQKIATRSCLSGEELETNRQQNKQRLITIFKQMQENNPMPAWGDARVCSYCEYSGLCRRAEWESEAAFI